MRLCFLFFGETQEAIAQVMIASVRQHMPNVIVTQLTDAKTKKVKGVDEVRRIDGKLYGYLLMRHMAECPLPFIRADYDMIFQGDITNVLTGEYDMAFNLHGDDRVLHMPFGKQYPIASSIWGANTHNFARDVRKVHTQNARDDWMDLVISTNEVAKDYRINLLDGQIYNYCPKDREDKPESALVLHYKGLRKHWMLPVEDEHLAVPDERRVNQRVRTFKDQDMFALEH